MRGEAEIPGAFAVSLVTYRQSTASLLPLIGAVAAEAPAHFTVVDHSPSDALGAELAEAFPSVEYVHEANRGFGAGHNVAFRKSLSRDVGVHIIVNPDVSFAPGTLRKIAGFLSSRPEIGLLMPKTVWPSGRLQHNCKLVPTPLDLIGRRFLPRAWMRWRTRTFELWSADYSRTFEVPYLCGCFMAFRMDALREVGLFDERFFLYPEDIDISRRMFASRFASVYWPGAEVVHRHEAASRHNFRLLAVHCWNMIRYFNKWGWLFDVERRRINRSVLAQLRGRSS